MSYDTNRNWFYQLGGNNQIRLYRLRKTSTAIPDSRGRFSTGDNELIYPDETITNGLRFEYTTFVKPFVTTDPNTLATDTDETTWTNPSLSVDASPSESSYVNVNRAVGLAVVCYIMARLAERGGNVELKEYYMREFWKKVSDEESNKRTISMAFSDPLTSVR
ncbi:MAG: hypothetical protein QF535_16300 [Anaerolineales bacterium]|jgi:hypothetical protein|nr:hypothetical protein [Anaerolineales bacterium]|tara:strand:+ start:1127 stop:1615 length:489 start_codon:yes stop_codon:yes gene_type:complete